VRAAFSLMSRSDATDRNEVGDADEIAFERGDTRNGDNTRVRPARKTAGALTTAASFETAADAGGTIGACFAGPRPNSVARSHVGNGAVKGARIRTTSQPATKRGNIGAVQSHEATFRPRGSLAIGNFPVRIVEKRDRRLDLNVWLRRHATLLSDTFVASESWLSRRQTRQSNCSFGDGAGPGTSGVVPETRRSGGTGFAVRRKRP